MPHTSRLSVRIFTFFTFFTSTIILAGCSQTTMPNHCTPAEKNHMAREHSKISHKILQKRHELITTHNSIMSNHCHGSPFSRHPQSAFCNRQIAKLNALQAEIEVLQHQASIYHAVANGASMSHPYLQDNGCAVRTMRHSQKTGHHSQKTGKKTKTRNAPAKVKKQIMNKQPQNMAKAAPTTMTKHLQEKVEYAVHTPPAVAKISHKIVPETLNKKEDKPAGQPAKPLSFSPVSQGPKNTTQTERPYQPNPQIRVIGSKFFPDQEAVTAPPTQGQNP